MNFPVFRTTWEVLEFCWVYRNRAILYGAIPVAITAVLNIAAWLAGADLTDPRNPAVVGLSLVNAIVFCRSPSPGIAPSFSATRIWRPDPYSH